MNKKNFFIVFMMLTAVNSLVFASEQSHFDFDELSFGLELSTVNTVDVISYSHSRPFSDSFFYTFDISQEKSRQISRLSNLNIGMGVGWNKDISDITDVYFEFSYSKTWVYGLSAEGFDSLHLKSGSITDISDKFQLITETSFNKKLGSNADVFNNSQRNIDFDIAGKFNFLNFKNQLLVGLSSNKGFPYFGMSFK